MRSEERILKALREARAKLALAARDREAIAIVGIGCRFPGGADGPDALWDLLSSGRDATDDQPGDRWDIARFYDPDPEKPGKVYVTRGGFLRDVDGFDPEFFGISSREAAAMDPQQRLLLEVAWEALEHAGIPAEQIRGTRTGIFMGLSWRDYDRISVGDRPENLDAYTGMGNTPSIAVGRLAYVLDVHGPVSLIDTACSSSLVAVHAAVQSLQGRECDAALAGGVNLILSPFSTVFCCKIRALSPDGRCKTFDASADGYGRAEGCGIVVLKRLSDACRDRDAIHAVIRGSAVNHDGRTGGLTVPSASAQMAVIRQALEVAGVDPRDVSYVEAHGTGTALGDPIEVGALNAVFRRDRKGLPLWVGSVKTRFGHAETAAGIAGLIGVALALRNGQIPASLHFKTPNPDIDWDDGPVRVAAEARPWPGGPRIAGVSSFGFSGTNAHVIVEAPSADDEGGDTGNVGGAEGADGAAPIPQVLTLSARSRPALEELARRYARVLRGADARTLAAICSTANVGRTKLEHRLAMHGVGRGDAAAAELEAFARGERAPGVLVGHAPRGHAVRTVLLFGHRSSAVPPLARDAYDGVKGLRDAVVECAPTSGDRSGTGFESALFSGCTREQALEDPVLADALAFTHQYVTARLLMEWGVDPVAVMGIGVGDYVAACVAGVLLPRDALMLLNAGPDRPSAARFVACAADEDALEDVLAGVGGQVIARAGGEFLVSAAAARSATLARELRSRGIAASAFRDARDVVGGSLDLAFECRAPRIAIVSAETGLRLGDEARNPRFWMGRPCWPGATVRAFESLFELGCHVIVESPGMTLSRLGRERPASGDVTWLQVRAAAASLHACWARLFAIGAVTDLRAFQGDRGRPAALPTYPFERRKLWLRAGDGTLETQPPDGGPGAGLGPGLDVPDVGTVYPAVLDARRQAYLDGHRVHGRIVVPATVFVDLARAADMRRRQGQGHRALRDVVLHAPLVLDDEPRDLRVVVSDGAPDGSRAVKIHAASPASGREWRCHLTARFARDEIAHETETWHREAAEARCPTPLDVDAFYARVAERGLSYGRAFRAIRTLRAGPEEAIGWIEPVPGTDRAPPAAALDAALQVAAAALALREDPVTRVPFAIDRIAQHQTCPDRFWSHARVEHTARDTDPSVKTHVRIYDQAERLCVEIDGVVLRALPPTALASVAAPRSSSVDDLEHRVRWRVASPPERVRPVCGERGLVFCDGLGTGDALIERLRLDGAAHVVGVRRGSATRRLSAESWQVEAASPAALASAVDDVLAAQGDASFDHVVYLWAIDESTRGDALMAGQILVCGGALSLLQALSRRSLAPAVWLVTSGATNAGDDAPAPHQAPLWGLGRTALRELPQLAISLVDLEPGRDAAWQADRLRDEVRMPVVAREVAHRGASRYVPELFRTGDRAGPRVVVPRDDNHALVVGDASLESLHVLSCARRAPAANEIEIAVEAAGLNFRDLLVALGSYPGDVPPLGGECFGRIAALGNAVRGFAVGQEVVAIASGAFARFVHVDARMVAPSPARLRSEQAAGIAVAYTTARHALHELARLRDGERVLIHAAAGGVGLAAVQLARRRGAEVLATAAPWKWPALRRLGVTHVMSSRTLDFADQVASRMAGAGVDVVVNSLTGPAIGASLALLRPGGRFIELGKLDIWSAERVRALAPGVQYHVLDLAEIDADRLGRMLRETCAALETGELAPLPIRTFPLEEAIGAFRYMARAQHIGKIVLEIGHRGATRSAAVRRDATYLVTGGLGGIGIEVGRWLVEAGAGEIVLVSRRVQATPAWQRLEAEGRQRGTTLRAYPVDVTDARALMRLLHEIDLPTRPLRGVIHAAGVLDDAVIDHLNWQRFWNVLSAKLEGAWHLHTLTLDRRLDFFCLFSSAASLLGAPGQASYAAANAFLDALAHHRRALGLPATVINWGAWADLGMTRSLDPATLARWRQRGVGMLAPEDAGRWLQRAVGAGEAQIAVLPIQWELFLRQFPAGGLPPILRASMLGGEAAGAPEGAVAGQPATTVQLAGLSPEGRQRTISSVVLRCVKQVLGSGEGNSIDAKRPLRDLGLDSLMALELRNLLGRALGLELPTSFAFDHPTVVAQTRALAAQLAGEIAPAASDDRATLARPAAGDPAAALDDLTDDELLALARTEVAAFERGQP